MEKIKKNEFYKLAHVGRNPLSYHGKGTKKYPDDVVDFISELRTLGFGGRKISKNVLNRFGIELTAYTSVIIGDNPHKYRINYVKPRDEYHSYKI